MVQDDEKKDSQTRAIHTLGDYAIAGSIAGAIFQGSRIEPSPSSTKDFIQKPPKSGAGTAQQRRIIGKGKVLNLNQTFPHPPRSSPSPSSVEPILHQATKLPIRSGIWYGLGPGFLLGLVAGSIQCLIYGVEDWIDQRKDWEQEEALPNEMNEKDQEEELDEEMEKKLKLVQQMSTAEIEEEIRKLQLELSAKGSSSGSKQKPNR